jgi:hypothetical protein
MSMTRMAGGIALTFALAFVPASSQGKVNKEVPGAAVSETPAAQTAEALVVLNEQLFNKLLEAVFAQLRSPSFPLHVAASPRRSPDFQNVVFTSSEKDECTSVIMLEREVSGVKTAVRFKDGRITAPLAFSGTYNLAMIGCVQFKGWADSSLNLYFDQAQQTLNGRFNVEDIHLTGIPSLAGGVLVPLVQSSLDQRINPVQILRSAQLSTRLQIAGSGGSLVMRAKEIRPEVTQGELRLHITYEFIRE